MLLTQKIRIAVSWVLLAIAGSPAVVAASSRYVSPTGNDVANDCTSSSSPCMTITAALEQAGSGDVIKLAGGTYPESVQIVVSGTLGIEGGYSPDFATRDLSEFKSVVDGEHTRVGVWVVVFTGGMTDLTIDGLTVTGTTGCGIVALADDPGSLVLGLRRVESVRNGECGFIAFDSVVTIEDSTFRKNDRGGLFFENAVAATIDRTLVVRNGLAGLEANSARGSILIRNSIFYANVAPAIGSQFPLTEPMDITIVNSTITKTRAPVEFAGAIDIRSCPATLNLQNTIVWKTRNPNGIDVVTDRCVNGPLEFNASHSNFSTMIPYYYNDLGGNVSVDPRLRSGERAILRPESPMIDAGECSLAPSDDVDGDARPSGGGCDIGANEFVP